MLSPEDSSGFEFRASDELSAGYRYTTPQPTVGDGLKSPNIKCERITHARPLFRFCVVVPRRAGVYRVKSAECPTNVKEVMTLLVNSKTLWKAIVPPTLEGQRDRGCWVEPCTPRLLEIQRP
jgi:hypothetical protein